MLVGEELAQQRLEVAEDGVEVEDDALDGLLAAEREELLGDGGGAVDGLLDVLEARWRHPTSAGASSRSSSV